MTMKKIIKNVPICVTLRSGELFLHTIQEAELTNDAILPTITRTDKKRIITDLEQEYDEKILSIDIDWCRMNVSYIDVL